MKRFGLIALLALSLAGCSLLKEAVKSCVVTSTLENGKISVGVSCDIPGHVHDEKGNVVPK